MTERDKLIEAMARAARAEGLLWRGIHLRGKWVMMRGGDEATAIPIPRDTSAQEMMARTVAIAINGAALNAIAEQGYAVVPKTVDDAMIEVAYEAASIDDHWQIEDELDWAKSYRAAIAAADIARKDTPDAS